ncbi:biotin--[acetyl-CoA-carboxylase] ligase [Flavobacterium antarcticum]|uniref:biotin--[acetyl-CoA-carboxylase] ligase n=1 Tax=Flavobacterium antarcticum TaxID=271155 RepID=UPI0003B7957B|nr:biotin--[acetyl-CoA-carboxylase] ligase [Flavobacterium antarcticum]
MKLIKLNATDSTNDFLKQLAIAQTLENYTVVATEEQLKGRGQMGSSWTSEVGKNLTFSVFLANALTNVEAIYNLNIAVAVSLLEVLKKEQIPELKIKWPNDIMSANKKIGGILIENAIKHHDQIQSIIGIGLNVNQQNYEDLPQASSLCLTTGQFYDREELLTKIVKQLKFNIGLINTNHVKDLWNKYHQFLYKKEIPSAFENKEGQQFMGIIKQVNLNGQLEVLMEDDSLQHFNIKELKMLY